MARLIHPRTEKDLLKDLLSIQPEHLAIAQQWKTWLTDGTLDEETPNHGNFLQNIMVDLLGYQLHKSVYAEYPVDDGDNGRVDLALGEFGKSADIHDRQNNLCSAPLELKGAKTRLDAVMSGRHKTPIQQAWEYATKIRGCSWVMVSNYREIRLYGYGYGQQSWESFALDRLDDPKEYTRFIKLLHADNLLAGKTHEWLTKSEKQEKEITNQLYKDYSTQRNTLIDIIRARNPKIDYLQAISFAQTLLDRILFLAFAENNQNLIPQSSLENAFQFSSPYDPKPKWENFKALFRAIDEGSPPLCIPKYNGGLFASSPALDALDLSDEVFAGLRCLWQYDFSSEVSVTVLGRIFEQSITDLEKLRNPDAEVKAGKRKKEGVVYTPDRITHYIVEETIGALLEAERQRFHNDHSIWINTDGTIRKECEKDYWTAWHDVLRGLRIVDPACGSGAFLVAAFDYLAEEYQRTKIQLLGLNPDHAHQSGEESEGDLLQRINHELRLDALAKEADSDNDILTQNLYGVDINSESVEITKLSLWLKTAKRGKILTDLDHTIRRGDSLIDDRKQTEQAFNWQSAFAEVFTAGGFDAVIGNPPYVRQELISPIKPWLEGHYKVYDGVLDLYGYFFERGISLLRSGGRLGFICSSTFFKTGSGQKLRQHLLDNTCLDIIVDFGDLQVFEGVTTYPAILILSKGEPAPDQELTFAKLTELPEKLKDAVKANGKTLGQNSLDPASWHLEDEQGQALRQKIIANHPTLKQVYGSPYRGVLTGLNEAFVIDRPTRDRLVADDPRSAELLKPFLEGKDLKKWHVTSRDLWLIFTRRGTDIEQYRAIKKHLEQFHARLEPKPDTWNDKKDGKWKGRKAGKYKWFETQDSIAYYDEFTKPKIIWSDISLESNFSLDESGAFVINTAYIHPCANKFLLSILNSKLTKFYISGISTSIRGGYFRFIAQNINPIPIPEATDEQKQRLGTLAERCQTQAEAIAALHRTMTRRLGDLAPKNWTGKPSKTLNQWPNLDFQAFRTQIKKDFKNDIPLTDRDAWQDYLKQHQNSYKTSAEKLHQTERLLNQEVYTLFNLTEADIAIIEDSI